MKRPGLIASVASVAIVSLAALAIISALAASPLFLNAGFLNTRGGGDSPFLLFRLHQLQAALGQGIFPARWMPDAAYGLGYPFFSYYAALPLYLAALFKFLGAAYVFALKLTQLAGFGLAALALYAWLRSAGLGRLPAVLAAGLYTFAPFHLVNVYVRGDSLNEFWAFGLYPLCLWAAHNLVRGRSPRSLYRRGLLLALAYAALVLTHNISALIFSPCLALYLLLLSFQPPPAGQNKPDPSFPLDTDHVKRPNQLRHSPFSIRHSSFIIFHSSFALVLGLALSAFFWIPALRETAFGQFAPVTQGYFNYANHFRSLDLVQPSLFFNFDPGSPDSSPFAMSLAQAALAVLALLIVAGRWVLGLGHPGAFPSLHSSFILICLAGATFMITPLSRPLWESLPLLPFVQFPWRFLSLQSLFVSALAGLAAQFAFNSGPSILSGLARPLAILLSGLYGLFNLGSLQPDFVAITDADITPARLQTYEYFTGNIGTTINYEYLPRWVQPRPYSSEEFIRGLEAAGLKVLQGEAAGERTAKGAASQSWRITVQSESASLAVPLLYWPGWYARADGQLLDIHPAENGLGWIAFDLPRGGHTLEFVLGDTDLRRNASLLSLAALVIALLLAQPRAALRAAFQRLAAVPVSRWLVVSAIGVGLVILAAAGRILNARAAPAGAATMDFDQEGYLYSSAVTFGNGDVLQGYNYSAERLRPGDLLGLALQWQAATAADFTLDLVSPAEQLLHQPATFASLTAPVQSRAAVLLPIPADLPTGVYLLRLSLIQNGSLLAPALTSSGQPRGSLYLRPIRIIADRPPTPAERQDSTPLTESVSLVNEVTAAQTDSATVALTLNWLATRPVPANYVLALRLRDQAGAELAALDTQPAGGMYPTSAWRPGTLIPDHYRFGLPFGLPPGDYPLTITLYDAATLAPAGALTRPVRLSQWTPPPGAAPLRRFTDALALQDVSLPETVAAGDRLTFTARWTSLAALPQDLSARWSAVSHNGEVVAVAEQPLAVIPTSQWAAGALVLGRPAIQLPINAKPGAYTLNVQLLDPGGGLLSPPVAVGRIAVTLTDRTTDLPPMQFKSGAVFGPLRLAGYDVILAPGLLTLTLHYRVTGAIPADYKYFVHVFNPAGEAIAAQADGFPARPTSEWQKDEVVSLTVRLSLADLAPGTVYNLGVGWYDPVTGNRLGERAILSQAVVRP